MKGLMFFAAGSVLHATGAKDMEQLGGLMRRMPWTGPAMTLGAVAIAALPPLNGFVSKWLVYMSLLECGLPRGHDGSLIALLAVGALALIGGLAALVFVRLIGIVMLGAPRSPAAEHAHESSVWMLGPMQLLVFLCLIVAVLPQAVTELVTSTLTQILGPEAGALLDRQAPLSAVGNANAWVLITTLTGVAGLLALTRRAVRSDGPTWGCGYAMPSVRMQYTGRSFAEMLAEHLLPRFLRPRTKRQAPAGLFPAAGQFTSESPDPIQENLYLPFFRRWANRFARLRFLQQGKVHVYLVYIMVIVVVVLSWAPLRTWLWGRS
jgi:NADH:ubiquinone oxidoreductase subunit 5 (subunit L)/multisubunit Na+/H+ antiporter MnhA subunit